MLLLYELCVWGKEAAVCMDAVLGSAVCPTETTKS